MGLVSASVLLVVGEGVLAQRFGLGLFGLVHWMYLALTVTLPMLAAAGALRLRSEHRRWAVAAAVTALAAVVVGVYSTHVAPFQLEVDRHTVVAPELNEPIRLVVLADIQNSRVTDYERNLLEVIAREEPDLVLMAGDLWQMNDALWPLRVAEFADLVRDIGEQWPLIMVDGDADWADGYDELVARSGQAALFMYDDVIDADINGQRVVIGGAARYPESANRRRAMFAALEANDPDAVTILLAHRPEIVYEIAPNLPPDLVVAGHTHGGQVSIPLFGPPITFTTVPRDVAAGGLHDVDGAALYVSTGVGVERHQAPQVRFGVAPSIGVIDLVPE